jgi:hypothetical protein
MTEVVVHGPVSWNHIVKVDKLPRPQPAHAVRHRTL